MNLLLYLFLLFFAILFLQSGIDKVLNPKGNIEWFKSQFQNTFLSPLVTLLFWVLTFEEILAGILAIVSIYFVYMQVGIDLINYAFGFCTFVLIQLFFGQRIAKDYTGASGIVPYIIVGFLSLFFVRVIGS